MNNVIVSVFKAGYTVRVDSKTVDSTYLRPREGLTARELTIKALERALKSAKTYTDHGRLIIEMSDSFIYNNLQDDRTAPTSSQEGIYSIHSLLQDCDATVQLLKTKQTHASRFVTVLKEKPAASDRLSLADSFAGID